MLHDFYAYKNMDAEGHAEKGAVLAREVLGELRLTSAEETDLICSAIHNHSSKGVVHSAFDEVLVDADVMQHCLYNFAFPVMEHEKERFAKLAREFALAV